MKNIINTINHNKCKLSLVAIFLGISLMANAQTTISGKVTDENESSLPGVNVIVKGTEIGTITDINGEYTVNISVDDAILIFSYVGYISEEVGVDNRSVVDVTLLPDLKTLDEIVVVGYGTQKKSDITGAIAVVDVEELDKSQYLNLTDRLQGRVPGVSVVTSGEPGSTGTIKIRGTSFFGDNDPLYVVDGILTDDSPNLNPYDVESVQVLKDASSTAIYGSRAANGVVVITTKKGRSKTPEVNFSATVGLQEIPNRVEMMDNVNFARVNNAAQDNSGQPRMTKADVDFDPNINTNWQDEMFGQGLIQDFNVSLSSGGEKYNAYFSVNNSYNEGTIKGSLFDRTGIRVNTSFTPWKNITIGQNLMVSRVRTSGLGGEAMISIYGNLPIIPVYDPNKRSGYGHGELGVATTYISNPKGEQDLNKDINETTRILGDVFLNWKIIEGLDYRFSLGVNSNFNKSKNYIPSGQLRMGWIHESRLNESQGESTEIFIENRLTYARTFGKHNFSVMATHTEQEINGSSLGGYSVNGYPEEPYFWVLDASVTPTRATGSEFSSAIRSYLGRLTYNYDDRYMLTGIIRHDGSSKFAEENRWGTFPSLSAGWNIANENFFNVESVSDLKLRAGYGEVGNSSIGDYQYQSLVVSSATNGPNYNLGPNGDLVIGATRGTLANQAITWEVLKETNFGIDVALFDGQLELTGDYFMGDLEGLLAGVAVPGSIGPAEGTEITINAVDMKRSGWEASISYRKSTGPFQFSTTFNAWHATNEVTKLPFGVQEFPGTYSTSRLGLPLGQLFLVEYLGIYTSQEQIDSDGITINGQVPVVGDARYRDIDSRDESGMLTGEPDGNISFDDDRQVWGNPIPSFEYGLNFDANWKGFDFYIFFQGVSKRDVYNSLYFNHNTFHATNYTADYDPYIEGSGTEPRPFNSEVANNFASSRFVEKASYLRLKNMQIGYTIPWNKVKNFRVFLSGQNLLVLTNYKGMDPEFEGGVFEQGVDPIEYPQVRTYSAGLNVTF